MDSGERESLHRAPGGERAVRVRDRMMLACFVPGLGMPRKAAARILRKRPRWVRKWPRRHGEGGLAALPDLPRSGRPRAVDGGLLRRTMARALRKLVTPDTVRHMIADAAGILYHHATVRRIMREFGLSPKVARLVHADRASRRAVDVWRRRTQKKIVRLRRRGFAVVVQDGPVFVHDAVAGVKYWTPVGVPADVTHAGSHSRVVVYGALAEDGRRPFRTHEKLNTPTFVGYLREPRRRLGKVAVMLDRAPQHTSRPARASARAFRGGAVLTGLPVGSPYLSAVEEAWRRAKRALLNPGRHPTREGFRRAIGEFFRGARYGLDIHAYLARESLA